MVVGGALEVGALESCSRTDEFIMYDAGSDERVRSENVCGGGFEAANSTQCQPVL